MVSVNAIRKMAVKPLLFSALRSVVFPHAEGREISNPPKKLAEKSNRIRKQIILKTALVDKALSPLEPATSVITSPKDTYTITIHRPYNNASLMP